MTGGSWLGGGGREQVPGTEAWMRLESQPFSRNAIEEDTAGLLAVMGPPQGPHAVPFFAWPLLAAAVLAISSAATAFQELDDVPPLTLAAWRLQLTSVLLLCGALWQWVRQLGPAERWRCARSSPTLALAGCCLAVHFGCWTWSLQHTSITHSLLLVCCVPLLLALGHWVFRQPISRGEIAGSVLGFLGGVLLAVGPRGDKEQEQVTVQGDLAALAAAFAIIGYLQAGRELRQFMGVFVYAFPVTALAAVLLSLAAMLGEGASLARAGAQGIFGWAASAHHAPWVVYLAVGPGIVGHTGFNTLLRYLTPLTVSLSFQLEPVVGTLIGWAAGMAPAPGLGTWVGGGVVLAATCWVVAATAKREALKARRGMAVLELEQVFGSETDGLLTELGGRAGGLAHTSSDDKRHLQEAPHAPFDRDAVEHGAIETQGLLSGQQHTNHQRHHTVHNPDDA